MYTMRHVVQGAAPTPQRTTAKLMKTGQTTSYRTGDDGDLEAGRDTSFTVLAENNPFGNTNRFTDELGGQTYTNDIVIDWSTYDGSSVLGYYRVKLGPDNWDNSIDSSITLSIGSFTSGWRLPNRNEYDNITNNSLTYKLNYAPFNLGSNNHSYWTSTDRGDGATALAYMELYGVYQAQAAKSTPYYRLTARTFTVTGTTLS